MHANVDLQSAAPTRQRRFCRGLGLAAFPLTLGMTMVSAAAFQIQLATWEGRVQKVTRDGLQATLDTGETAIRLSKGSQAARNGFTTAVFVTGSDRISVLKPGVHVRFECDLDEQGLPVGTILKIEAQDEPFSELGIFPVAVATDPAAGGERDSEENPGQARVEIVGELRKVDQSRRTIDVWYPKDNLPTTRRGPFPIDPAATRVDFAFVDLAHAKLNDVVVIRGFMSEGDGSIVATEIRVRRVDVFPVLESDGAQLDPLVTAPGLGLADATPAADDAGAVAAEPAVDDPEKPIEADGSMTGDDPASADSMIPPGLREPSETEAFEFPKNAPPKTAEEKARRHYKIN